METLASSPSPTSKWHSASPTSTDPRWTPGPDTPFVAKTTPRTGWRPNDRQSCGRTLNYYSGRPTTDPRCETTAFQKLSELRMQGSDIDSYIADFDRLIDEAGSSTFDHGSPDPIQEGLQPSLLREILLHTVPAPQTLLDWKQKARERQTVYKNYRTPGCTGEDQWTSKTMGPKLGLQTYQTPHQEEVKAIDHLTSPRALKSSQWT